MRLFSLLMGWSRKNGRLGDPALPSLNSNFYTLSTLHPQFLESPSGGCRIAPPTRDFCGLIGVRVASGSYYNGRGIAGGLGAYLIAGGSRLGR